MADLSPERAVERAAAASADYNGICWKNSFPDTGTDQYPFWAGYTDAHRVSAKRAVLVTIYSFLHMRSEKDPALEAERLRLLEDIPAEWRPILARVLMISESDLAPRKPRRAFGADLSNPANDLLAFAWDQEMSAGLLAEAFRRDEIRRLEHKASLLRCGGLSQADQESDRLWQKRNCETFGIAQQKVQLAKEARAASGATHD